jgi:hypothetical protein
VVRIRRKIGAVLVVVAMLPLFLMGCSEGGGIDIFGDNDAAQAQLEEERARKAVANPPTEDANPNPSGSHAGVPVGTDEVLTMAYQGENLAYHTALLNSTAYYVDYETGAVTARGSKSFEEEETAGVLVRRGTDTVKFNGAYDPAAKTITGTLTVRTQGKATGGKGDYDNTLTFEMTGQLDMTLSGESWSGTVSGTSMLTQVWDSGDHAPCETPRTVKWTVTSATRELL